MSRAIDSYAEFVAGSICSLERFRRRNGAPGNILARVGGLHGARCRFCALSERELVAELKAARETMRGQEATFASLPKRVREERVRAAQELSWVEELTAASGGAALDAPEVPSLGSR